MDFLPLRWAWPEFIGLEFNYVGCAVHCSENFNLLKLTLMINFQIKFLFKKKAFKNFKIFY